MSAPINGGVLVFDASGILVHQYTTTDPPFGSPTDVAVDPAETCGWSIRVGILYELAPDGTQLRTISPASAKPPHANADSLERGSFGSHVGVSAIRPVSYSSVSFSVGLSSAESLESRVPLRNSLVA